MFKKHLEPRRELPPVGLYVTYKRDGKSAEFMVAEVDQTTGRIEMIPTDPDLAREALTITVKNKHGEDIQTTDFAWVKQTSRFAVNVEWDAWILHTKPWEG